MAKRPEHANSLPRLYMTLVYLLEVILHGTGCSCTDGFDTPGNQTTKIQKKNKKTTLSHRPSPFFSRTTLAKTKPRSQSCSNTAQNNAAGPALCTSDIAQGFLFLQRCYYAIMIPDLSYGAWLKMSINHWLMEQWRVKCDLRVKWRRFVAPDRSDKYKFKQIIPRLPIMTFFLTSNGRTLSGVS